MAIFAVHFEEPESTIRVVAHDAVSFDDAIEKARAKHPKRSITSVRVVDDPATLTFHCPKCGTKASQELAWAAGEELVIACVSCRVKVRVQREVRFSPVRAIGATKRTHDPVFGSPPEDPDVLNMPASAIDQLRAMFDSPSTLTWNCAGCKWHLRCDWGERKQVHLCPDCGCRQYVPSHSMAWNVRMLNHIRSKALAAKIAQDAAEEEKRRVAERAAARAKAEAAKRVPTISTQRANTGALVMGVGLAGSNEYVHGARNGEAGDIQALSRLADELKDDLLAALGHNAKADRAVATGRPIAAGVSALDFYTGHPLAGLLLGALAVGARTMSDDWKRAKSSEYRLKWTRIFSELSAEQLQTFLGIFSSKYPALASMASSPGGFFPQ